MLGLHARGDSELGEAPEVLVVHQLGVLDAGRKAKPTERGAAGLEGVERDPHRVVTDGMDRHRESSAHGAAHQALELVGRNQGHSPLFGAVVRIEHRGRA